MVMSQLSFGDVTLTTRNFAALIPQVFQALPFPYPSFPPPGFIFASSSRSPSLIPRAHSQINLINTTATVFIGSTSSSGVSIFNAVCRPLLQFAPGTTQCACYSSCPAPVQLAQQLFNTQTNYQTALNAVVALQNASKLSLPI
jgi:hypothetical protein